MQFSISQPKLKELLQKLSVSFMFPSTVLFTKDGQLLSIQREISGSAIRYAKFNSYYFEVISHENDAVMIDANKALDLIKLVPSTESIEVEKKGDKLCFTDSEGTTKMYYEDPGKQLIEKLPFEIKDGVPYVGKGKIPLDTVFIMKLSDLKKATEYGKKLGTYYNFLVSQNSLSIEIGGTYNKRKLSISGVLLSGKPVNNYYTFGIREVARTFRQDEIVVQTAPNAPGWFSEASQEIGYELALMVTPFIEEG